jgi:hypothetical protein
MLRAFPVCSMCKIRSPLLEIKLYIASMSSRRTVVDEFITGDELSVIAREIGPRPFFVWDAWQLEFDKRPLLWAEAGPEWPKGLDNRLRKGLNEVNWPSRPLKSYRGVGDGCKSPRSCALSMLMSATVVRVCATRRDVRSD